MRAHYILKGREIVEARDFLAWAEWFEQSEPLLVTRFDAGRVSTIFLGVDHNLAAIIHGDESAPKLLFETMAFGGPLDREQVRCSTYEQAERQHELMVARVRHAGDVVGTGRPS